MVRIFTYLCKRMVCKVIYGAAIAATKCLGSGVGGWDNSEHHYHSPADLYPGQGRK